MGTAIGLLGWRIVDAVRAVRAVVLPNPVAQALDTEYASQKKYCRDRQKGSKSKGYDEEAGQHRTKKCPGTAAGCNDAEQAAALFPGIDVRHETPEDGDDEQIEDAKPDEKRSADPDDVDAGYFGVAKQGVKNQNIGNEKIVDPGQELLAWKS